MFFAITSLMLLCVAVVMFITAKKRVARYRLYYEIEREISEDILKTFGEAEERWKGQIRECNKTSGILSRDLRTVQRQLKNAVASGQKLGNLSSEKEAELLSRLDDILAENDTLHDQLDCIKNQPPLSGV